MPLLVLAAAIAATAVAPSPAPKSVLGVWTNPKSTLAVRAAPCGDALCGTIVHAAPKAVTDAREAGVPRLIGIQLLQGYRPTGRGSWAGRVYVPDMGRSFSSRIRQTAPDRLTISGCLIGALFCRSQQWRRAP